MTPSRSDVKPEYARLRRRARSALDLRTILGWCEDLQEQNRRAKEDGVSIVLAVDPDVISMHAFPLESLAYGSVFHAWVPLRRFGQQVAEALRQNDMGRFLKLVDTASGDEALRSALVVTIALGQYVFGEALNTLLDKALLLLPPHEEEWDAARSYSGRTAKSFASSQPKAPSLEQLEELISSEPSFDMAAKRLIEELPSYAALAFPAELRPDFGNTALNRLAFMGRLKTCDAFFDKGRESFHSILGRTFAAALVDRYSEALAQDAGVARGAESKNIRRDAQVLAWLQTVNSEAPEPRMRRKTTGEQYQHCRVILLSASARLHRVLRKQAGENLARSMVRHPLAYLGEGAFFEWTFRHAGEESSASAESKGLDAEKAELIHQLKRSQFTQWLTPLTLPLADDEQQVAQQQHLQAVQDWERLTALMGTAMNLGYRRDGVLHQRLSEMLRRFTEQNLDPVVAFATRVQSEVIETSLRLSQGIGYFALDRLESQYNTWRNVPPIRLPERSDVRAVYLSILLEDLRKPTVREAVLQRVLTAEGPIATGERQARATKYARSLLMSAIWARLGEWRSALSAVTEAVTYAFERSSDQSIDEEETLHVEEALYLLAVFSRLNAAGERDLDIARLGLDVAQASARNGQGLRFEAEAASLRNAEVLFKKETAAAPNVVGIRFQLLKKRFDESGAWQDLRKHFINDPASWGGPLEDFERSFVLQQMYCALILSFLFYWKERPNDARKEVNAMQSLLSEFHQFVKSVDKKSLGRAVVQDSSTPKILRAALVCALDGKDDGRDLEHELIRCREGNGLSSLDIRRNDWLRQNVLGELGRRSGLRHEFEEGS